VSGVDDVAGKGPCRYCSPRHRMPVYSREEGSQCVSAVDDVAWRALSARPHLASPSPPGVRASIIRGAHSSTSRLNVTTFRGILWVVSVTKTAQVEVKSGRSEAPANNLARPTALPIPLGGGIMRGRMSSEI